VQSYQGNCCEGSLSGMKLGLPRPSLDLPKTETLDSANLAFLDLPELAVIPAAIRQMQSIK
jgi:hypothetical protein